MTIQEEFYSRIDNDNGYDNQKLGDDLIKISEKHHKEQLSLCSVSGSAYRSNLIKEANRLQNEAKDKYGAGDYKDGIDDGIEDMIRHIWHSYKEHYH